MVSFCMSGYFTFKMAAVFYGKGISIIPKHTPIDVAHQKLKMLKQ